MADELNQSRFLAAIADAVKRKQAGEDPELDPRARRMLPNGGAYAPDILSKPMDPEATANARIDAAANRPGMPQPGGQFQGQQLSKKINPETGMPFFSDPEPSQEDPQVAMKREMLMKMMQEASQTGKIQRPQR